MKEQTAKNLAILLNELCNRNAELTRNELINKMRERGISMPDQYLKPLRNTPWMRVKRERREYMKYIFVKPSRPIFYQELYKLEKVKKEPVKKDEVPVEIRLPKKFEGMKIEILIKFV